ncbi:cytochrome P450 [Nonomuraea sp. NPDC052116]|uniref:cytochrome P450 family protein n=1 Tax=Nonomuraea sp. NPDC052116 TaxID=3155665 RepID=UPI00344A42FC
MNVPDLWSEEFHADPFPVYARLREEAPIHSAGGPGTWIITRYDDARAALTDPRLSKDPRHAPGWVRRMEIMTGGEGPTGTNMINNNPPDHTRQRRSVSRAFTRRRVEALEPRIREITDDLVAKMAVQTEVDLVKAFAVPLPIIVICEMLGVPAAHRDDLHAWTAALLSPAPGRRGTAERRRARRAMESFMIELIAAARRELDRNLPPDQQPDLLRALILAAEGEGGLSERELLGMIRLLVVAGHETMAGLITTGVLTLLAHPEQAALLRARPDLMPSAIEELLRVGGAADRATLRFATEDVSFPGGTVPAGEVVSVCINAANRDPERFPRPDAFDVTRTDNPHLSFGHGIHFCLGAPLARLQARIAFSALLRGFPGLALACPPERLRWHNTGGVRSVRSLPVRLSPLEESHA